MSVFLRKAAVALCAVMLPLHVAFSQSAETDRAPSALTEWVEEALRISPELERAKAALSAARARYRAAGQPLYNPELALEAERTDINTIAAGINQTLDWGGKREQRSAVGKAELVAAKARLAEARLILASRLLSALSEHSAAQEIAAL
ncbi:TolC family protein, partial [Thiohalomonas denitrificans]|uniref:TolC family protein n=1 Tax=Thiohalomonas denitrificans TaxID=415747 RepID=UPI0026EC088F